jgi:hypothetical protein
MGYEENIKKDLVTLLNSRGEDAVEVTSWEDTIYSDGYCETCYYESAAVKIYYVDSEGTRKSYLYRDDFTSLIYDLDNLGE